MEQNLEEDARPFCPSPTTPTEHYDAAIVYAEPDADLAIDIMDHLNKLVLDDRENPKVCLYGDPKGTESETEAGGMITQVCTLVLVLATEHLHNSTVALLIKDEAIGNTRLAKQCHKDLKYCVRPVYVEKERTYRAPAGLSAIVPINWYNKDSRSFQRNIKILFNQHTTYRKQRERRQCRSASNSSFNEGNLQPSATRNISNGSTISENQAPRDQGENSGNQPPVIILEHAAARQGFNVDVPELTVRDTPNSFQSENIYISEREAMSPESMPSCNLHSLNSNESVDAGEDIQSSKPGYSASALGISPLQGNANTLKVLNDGLSRNGSQDSGQGESLSPRSNSPSEVSSAMVGSHSSGNDINIEQSAAHQGFPDNSSNRNAQANGVSTTSAKGHGDDSEGFSVEEKRSSEVSDAENTQTSMVQVEGNPGQLTIDESDIVTDSSLQRSTTNQNVNTGETRDSSGSTVASVGTSTENTAEDADSKGRQRSGEKTEDNGSHAKGKPESRSSDESSGKNVKNTISTMGDSDLSLVAKNNADTVDSPDGDSSDVGKHVLTFTGPAYSMAARCAAPNEKSAISGQKEGFAPAVVHYHTHYHGDAMDTRAHTAAPGIDGSYLHRPRPQPSFLPSNTVSDVPGPPPQSPPTARPINIVNCSNVQIGTSSMRVTGKTGGNVETGTVTENNGSDRPPDYSVEDPLRSASHLQTYLSPSIEGRGVDERGDGGGGRHDDMFTQDQRFTLMKAPFEPGAADLTGVVGGGEGGGGGGGVGGGGGGGGGGEKRDGCERAERIEHDQRLRYMKSQHDHQTLEVEYHKEEEKEEEDEEEDYPHMKSCTDLSSPPVTDAVKSLPDLSDDFNSDRSGASVRHHQEHEHDDCSLPVPDLGSGDDLKKMLMTSGDNQVSGSTRVSEASPEADRTARTSASTSDDNFSSCQLFCRETRRRKMLTGAASSMGKSVATCVDCGNTGSDLD